jgi:peptidyl-prolyl cis-trans isomerase C
MRIAADQALANEVLRRSLAPHITEPALKALYDAEVAPKPGPEEVDVRIIMATTKEAAVSLLARLQAGADFASLARDESKDGTASRGGDLGYVRLEMLSPELGSVAFALAVGETTAFPVRSGGRWFIMRVEGRRQLGAPSFASSRVALEQDVIHAGVPMLMQEALKAAPVTYHSLVGLKPPDAKAPDAKVPDAKTPDAKPSPD